MIYATSAYPFYPISLPIFEGHFVNYFETYQSKNEKEQGTVVNGAARISLFL